MRDATVTAAGARMRWVEMPGDPQRTTRVYLHGLGASAAPYFAASAAHPALAGHRSLLLDLLGFGISDRPTDFAYTLEDHADAVAAALEAADVPAADIVGHSMGGAVAIVLAARHPHRVERLVLVDATLDPVPAVHGWPGARGIAAYTEEEFLADGWRRFREAVGPHWWSTMRLAGREALYRSAVHLARGTEPALRDMLTALPIPRTYLRPEADQPLPGAQELTGAGVEVVSIPDCGHNIMLDNPEAFAQATARALSRA
ncbi:alpha/beta fold hydrolase [Streptomyces sp. WAC06614]|uniref:alpha/beta fold hydrolase n=1 Tax=Streptomyces sp. WAC06614 TaxID=2487416 RepID=UPI000F7A046D|nr:alpha/beta hydrolase [Streptomyces sp. WAC06614]RSS83659.1 alpha/beta hydrolase [Streptomyces sp. WAC06614]